MEMNNFTGRDINLTKRVIERLRWDKRVSSSDVHVISRSGKVTLIGVVDSKDKKHAAFEVASNTKGVTNVVNQLEIPEQFTRTDTEIRSLLENRVREMTFVDREFIAVEVNGGVVKLTGNVKSKVKKSRASGFAWELSGVLDCKNLIEISGQPRPLSAAGTPERATILLEFNGHENLSPSPLAL